VQSHLVFRRQNPVISQISCEDESFPHTDLVNGSCWICHAAWFESDFNIYHLNI